VLPFAINYLPCLLGCCMQPTMQQVWQAVAGSASTKRTKTHPTAK
jgi:hypothetical protein